MVYQLTKKMLYKNLHSTKMNNRNPLVDQLLSTTHCTLLDNHTHLKPKDSLRCELFNLKNHSNHQVPKGSING